MFRRLAFLRQNKYLFYISAITILANIFSWILAFLFIKAGKFNIILHYDILFGADYQGSRQKLFTIPAIGLGLFFMNSVISGLVYKREKFIAGLFLFASLVVQIFVIIAIGVIVFVNRHA